MARINLAFIQGYVEEDPIIIKDDNQNIKRVMLNLQLSRGFREVGDGRTENRYDVIQLATEEEFNTKIMADLKRGDIIRVKGVYTTTLGEKVYTCKNCGRKTRKISMITFVTPIKIDIVSRNNSPNDAFKYITQNKEISNQLYFFGTLMTDPIKIKLGDKKFVCQYQVANGRKYIIKSDDPNNRFDYPWVKTYGDNAKEDKKRLYKGSEVFLDGFLQTRYFDRKFVCGQAIDENGKPLFDEASGKPLIEKDKMGNYIGCGTENISHDYTTEIVPYEVEYLSNYKTDEILEEEAKSFDNKEEKNINIDNFFDDDVDIDELLDANSDYTNEDVEFGLDVKDDLG